MIFVGDIALEDKGTIQLEGVPPELLESKWVGNLEGPVNSEVMDQKAVYTTKRSLDALLSEYSYVGLSLANNHILDLGMAVAERTVTTVQEAGVIPFGFGSAEPKERHTLRFTENGESVLVLNYGWSVIGCVPAGRNRLGCLDLSEENMVSDVLKARHEDANARIIVYVHWGIELEVAPQPYHRLVSKRLIDAGANAIIGCHAHRFQGAEVYKGKPIVYGVGNWMFARKTFWGGKLDYPATCNRQLAVDLKVGPDKIIAHVFGYEEKPVRLVYEAAVPIDKLNESFGLKPFNGMSDEEYATYFLSIREKTKLLPVYQVTDGPLYRKLKDKWIAVRHLLLIAVKFLKS